jgi:hypothetical protein
MKDFKVIYKSFKRYNSFKLRLSLFALCIVLLSVYFVVFPAMAEEEQALESQLEKQDEIHMLSTISELQNDLTKRIAQKKKLIAKTDSSTEKEQLEAELKKLDEQYNSTRADFERIATGVELSLFRHEQEQAFDWEKELLALVEPGVNELKRMTKKIRDKSALKDELAHYTKLSLFAQKAVENIEANLSDAKNEKNGTVQKNLKAILPEWKNMLKQFESKAQITQMKLQTIISEEKSLIETGHDSVKNFFRTRGLYLFIGILSFLLSIIAIRLATEHLIRRIPGYSLPYKPFHIRVLDLSARVASLIAGLFILGLVFFLFEDWVLLSLFIIFLLGLGWLVRNTAPRFLKQSRLMLNIGAVREGERLIYQGVPWLVKNIHLFCTLENPAMGLSLRLPIENLLDQISRPFDPDEPWFPCRKNEWVILSDGTWGQIKSLSHETVEIRGNGNTSKLYQTGDFLSQAPLNISRGFRLRSVFGISYDLQKDITGEIPNTIKNHIQGAIKKEGYKRGLMELRVEFQAAGPSSLDIVVIADFEGKMAPDYNRLSRSIQCWCVDACTLNNWEIPFPQLTVHKR